MPNNNNPTTIQQFEEALHNGEVFRFDNEAVASTLEKYPASKPGSGGTTSYLLIDDDTGEVAEVLPTVEAAVLYLLFHQGHLQKVPRPEEPLLSRPVTPTEVYRAISRQWLNYEGECPICHTTNPLMHDASHHLHHLEERKPPCQHTWSALDGAFCVKCFLSPLPGGEEEAP